MNMNLGLPIKIFLFFFISLSVSGETIQKKYALFKLLNKTTNKVTNNEILVNSVINWETLNINVLYCATNPPNEIPENYVLVDVYDNIDGEKISIFRGWMISSAPDITPLENPIYDLWLIGCTNDKIS